MPWPPPRLYAVSARSVTTGPLGREGEHGAETREPGDQPRVFGKSPEETSKRTGCSVKGQSGDVRPAFASELPPSREKDEGDDMKKLLTAALAVAATPAFAHHPLGGMQMETFSQGLLSGVGHPVLGFDHLAFVLVMGIAAVYTGRRFAAPLAYIAAMLVGTMLMAGGVGLPLKEAVIALSLVVVGGVVLSGRALTLLPALALFAGFGLFHGSAFGDSLAGVEGAAGGAVMAGYLIGLGVVQYALALAAGWAVEKLAGASQAAGINARLAGAAVAGIGAFLTLEVVEGPVLAALFGV